MRLIAFITVLFLAPLLPIWLSLVLFGAYALLWPDLELVVLGGLLDAFFAPGTGFPVYLLGAFLLTSLSLLLRPHLVFYNG